jgi:hypothetical protein
MDDRRPNLEPDAGGADGWRRPRDVDVPPGFGPGLHHGDPDAGTAEDEVDAERHPEDRDPSESAGNQGGGTAIGTAGYAGAETDPEAEDTE